MTDPVKEAESIVKRSRRRPGYIAAGTLLLSLVANGVLSTPASASGGSCSLGGRNAGIYVPCNQPRSAADRAVEKGIGTTTVGCALGLIFGEIPGMVAGCVGGAAGNIPW